MAKNKAEKIEKTNAMRILETEKLPFQTYSYECEDFIDGVTMAEVIGQDVKYVYKTLVTVGKSKEYFVFVIPVAEELDMKKAAHACGEKSIEMIHVKDITNVTGYIRGGCTAIGMKKPYKTYVDESARELDKIIVSAGKRGMQIELLPEDYITACNGTYADIIMR